MFDPTDDIETGNYSEDVRSALDIFFPWESGQSTFEPEHDKEIER